MSKTTQIRQQVFAAPAAAGNTNVHAAITLPSSGTTVVTTAITNPAVPRTIRLKGNQSTTQGLVVTIAGTDILGNTISEDVTMGGAFATPTDSTKAFATVTSITVPTRGGASDTISVGFGAALGLDCYCDVHSFKGFYDATQVYSYTYSTTDISLNVVTLAATLNGSTDQVVNYIPSIFPAYGRTYG